MPLASAVACPSSCLVGEQDALTHGQLLVSNCPALLAIARLGTLPALDWCLFMAALAS